MVRSTFVNARLRFAGLTFRTTNMHQRWYQGTSGVSQDSSEKHSSKEFLQVGRRQLEAAEREAVLLIVCLRITASRERHIESQGERVYNEDVVF